MYYDLEKKIEEYSEELFSDLGLVNLAEDDKADLYARVKERLHTVIDEVVQDLLEPDDVAEIKHALDHEDYHSLDEILKKYPEHKTLLQDRIDEEFQKLKLTVAGEQEGAGDGKDA